MNSDVGGRRLSSIQQPGRTIIFTDWQGDNPPPHTNAWGEGLGWLASASVDQMQIDFRHFGTPTRSSRGMTFHPDGLANYLFLDDHVESFNLDQHVSTLDPNYPFFKSNAPFLWR